MTKSTSKRILALDILRGITIAGMLMVNNPGSWGALYTPLAHAPWHGLTPTDLIFPFFMFIMGISTYISLRKFNFVPSKSTIYKIIERSCIIFLIGLTLGWIGHSIISFNNLGTKGIEGFDRLWQAMTNFESLRLLGVMQRLGITYGAAALVAVLVKHKHIPFLIATILIGYMLLLLVGTDGLLESETSIISVIDTAILGKSHLYKASPIDPEGLISTLPSIAHVLIGFLCGKILVDSKDNHKRIEKLFIVGAALSFAGFLLHYACPINKKLWTPSFVIATCGMAASFLALLTWIIDIKGYKKWTVFFESFGINPLFIFVLGTLLTILTGFIRFPFDEGTASIKEMVYGNFLKPVLSPSFGEQFSSLIYSILFITVLWIIGHQLYKRKIYIKI